MRLAALATCVAAALLSSPARAEAISFVQEGAGYATGVDPYGVIAPDLNGDSLPDIATVNGTPSNLSVFLRQPGGGFSQETGSPFAVGSGPNYAAVADFDGNGRPDLAVSNFVSSDVTVLLRQAGGGFAQEAGSPFGTGGRASAIAGADFTGDGRTDLAVTRLDDNTVAILHRGAAGGFSIRESVLVGGNPSHLAAADFNGDGLPDLAVANRATDNVTILLRSPGNLFGEETPAPSVGDQPINVVAADFSGDGRPDLAVSNYAAGSVSILLRNAAGDGFTPEVGSPIPVGDGPVGLAIADFDSDGAPDLAVANNTGGTVSVLRRVAGGFTRDPVNALPLGNRPYGLAVADFDRDGRPDLAVGHDGGSELRILLNTTPPPDPGNPPPDGPTDTDGDGVFDPDDLCPTVPANTPDGCPRASEPELLPPPILGETTNAAPVKGKVRVGIPAGSPSRARIAQKGVRFVPLTEARQIPIGSFLDTREGTVGLTLARDARGRTQSGEFAAGLFQVLQSRRKRARGLTKLRMKGSAAAFRRCTRGKRAGAKASRLSRRAIRRLRARARGRYRTRGRRSAATVRGTKWTVVDRCDGTLTKVRRGKVAVRDFRLRKTVVLTRGKRYLARAPDPDR